MSFSTAEELGRVLVRLRLVDPSQLDECLVRLEPRKNKPADLLQVLEAKNYLTPYQISSLQKGETDGLVLGDYKLIYRNASGSFARVFRACSITDGRMVGLKLLRQRWAKDARVVREFRREAEVCKQLRHPNIVPIYDVGSQGDHHYFTMEFIEGGNLHDFINIRKKLSPLEATRCILDMSKGLDYALGKGITHRDMKLSNVLMSTQGVAKLVDFGLAGSENITSRGSGETPQHAIEYATLERWTNAPINDPRSDLYFMGTIYYELLTGQPPYPRTRSRDERKQIARYKNIRPIRELEPNLPRIVVAIVERLMQINPDHRYQRPADVINDLTLALAEFGENGKVGPQADSGTVPTTLQAQRSLPTVMCVESRAKQQNQLRKYLSKRGFRVLVLTDLQRALSRLEHNPPDCIVLMGDAVGDDIVSAYKQASEQSAAKSVVVIAILSEKQAKYKAELEQTHIARVLVQPVTLRDLRREIHFAFQRRLRDSREKPA
jgi:serine/threonine protein kinase